MFCANCGKTLKAGGSACPHCGAPVGENRFQGNPYTSAQPRIAPGEAGKLEEQMRAYTRTTYMGNSGPEDDVLSRTTYRPVLSEEEKEAQPQAQEPGEESAPPVEQSVGAEEGAEALFGEPESAPAEGESAPPAEEAGAPAEAANAEPSQASEPVGISDEVKRIIESDALGRGDRVRRANLAAKLPFGRKEAEPLFDDMPAPGEGEPSKPASGASDFSDYGLDDEDDDDARGARPRGNVNYAAIAKYAAIAIVIVAIFVGGYLWLSYVMKENNASPIEGVTKSLYEEGLAYMDTLAAEEYKTQMIQLYQTDLLGFTAAYAEKTDAIEAMRPQEPLFGDDLFIRSMRHVAENIGNALTMDGMAASRLASADAAERAQIDADSASRWEIVGNGLAALKAATTEAHLTSIVNSQKVTATVEEPDPIDIGPTYDSSGYTALAKDMSSDAVKAMQEKLIELGWLVDVADGVFGSKTLLAVKLFQEAGGFDVDGIASPDMQALLFSPDAPAKAPTPTAAP